MSSVETAGEDPHQSFAQLGLNSQLLDAIEKTGYTAPSAIQAATIPHLLAGRDVLGQAQTGTGKTAAFALPLLQKLDTSQAAVKILVLTPTRELAIQVCDAFEKYGRFVKQLKLMPIYGGQDYEIQFRKLNRGVQVVVGTPGRVMDHMRRGTLDLSSLDCLVLDEADEMLKMGFVDDVEWVLSELPGKPQLALFSATMPPPIRKLTSKYLDDPAHVTIQAETATVKNTRQRSLVLPGRKKMEALLRILASQETDGVIVFAKTRNNTEQIGQRLREKGYAAASLNGDMSQRQREQAVERLRAGRLDILVATDVAARGLDVERVSLVVNFDMPHDSEAYIHRIGRTGRAGRSGDAILFVKPDERRSLRYIEQATGQPLEAMELPSRKAIHNKRIADFKQRVSEALVGDDLEQYQALVDDCLGEIQVPPERLLVAFAKMLQQEMFKSVRETSGNTEGEHRRSDREGFRQRSDRGRSDRGRSDHDGGRQRQHGTRPQGKDRERSRRPVTAPEEGMQRYRVQVGREHGVRPGNLVGAIANEAGLDSQYIGRINIFDQYSTVDLPAGMPSETFQALQDVWVSGQQLKISRERSSGKPSEESTSFVRGGGRSQGPRGARDKKQLAAEKRAKKRAKMKGRKPSFRR